MLGSRVVAFVLLLRATIHASAIIDSYLGKNSLDDDYLFNKEREINEDCPLLSDDLRNEIRSYQPIVDKIAAAVINGAYSSDTWNAYVLPKLIFLIIILFTNFIWLFAFFQKV